MTDSNGPGGFRGDCCVKTIFFPVKTLSLDWFRWLWGRAVASSPTFRRRFRSLKPPPLLGLFFQNDSADQGLNIHGLPAFVPARRRDRDLTAAVRGGDFFLTSLQDLIVENLSWYIVDCCRGCVLLMNGDLASFVVFNPLTRRCEDAFHIWPEDAFHDYRGYCRQLDARLVVSREDPTSFRVVILSHDKSRVRATVYSSDTWEWSVLPWVDVPATSSDYDNRWIQTDGVASKQVGSCTGLIRIGGI
ncbi:hypothetical protein EJB05_16310, partial [Eragrostis curvula]